MLDAERRQHLPDRGDVAAAVRVRVAAQRVLNRGDVSRSRVAAGVSRCRQSTAPASPGAPPEAACRRELDQPGAAPVEPAARRGAEAMLALRDGGSGSGGGSGAAAATAGATVRAGSPRRTVEQLGSRPEGTNRLRAIAGAIERLAITFPRQAVSKLERRAFAGAAARRVARGPASRTAARARFKSSSSRFSSTSLASRTSPALSVSSSCGRCPAAICCAAVARICLRRSSIAAALRPASPASSRHLASGGCSRRRACLRRLGGVTGPRDVHSTTRTEST